MHIDPACSVRRDRVMRWFAPARFGLMYSWGLYTGGGSSEDPPFGSPLAYDSIEAFEAAAPDPDAIAANLVAAAVHAGARYIEFTLFHTCDRYCILYPTAHPAFRWKTRRDYVGPLAERCRRAGIRLLLYIPGGGLDGHQGSGPHIDPEWQSDDQARRLYHAVIREAYERWGDGIAGWWLDGNDSAFDLPEYIHSLDQDAIVLSNNDTALAGPGVDFGTTELLHDQTWPAPPVRREPEPRYNRAGMLRRSHQQWGILAPRRDFNEDLPTPCDWWYNAPYRTPEDYAASPYVTQPTHLVQELVTSLGQRGQWNYCLGIGPLIDGRMPPLYQPMFDTLHRFMAWAGEAIYDTTGGEGSCYYPGWANIGGFLSVTRSLDDPHVHYLIVTTPPAADSLRVQTDGYLAASVTDLRTGQRVPFLDRGCLEIVTTDWADIATYGARIFKVVVRA